MKGQFNGKVEGSIDLDTSGVVAPFLIINEQPVSLRAIETVARTMPDMLAVLEELAKSEAEGGGVFRVEFHGSRMRLFKIGLVAHVGHKAEQLRRRMGA